MQTPENSSDYKNKTVARLVHDLVSDSLSFTFLAYTIFKNKDEIHREI